MVESQVVSITPATHADAHRHGGTDPLTGDVRVDGLPAINDAAEVNIFTGAAPIVFTNLDLSAHVGANIALVAIRARQTTAGNSTFAFREGDDTTDYYAAGDGAISTQRIDATVNSTWTVAIVSTNAAGVIQWRASAAAAVALDLLWYIA